jgi:hypothetical protein
MPRPHSSRVTNLNANQLGTTRLIGEAAASTDPAVQGALLKFIRSVIGSHKSDIPLEDAQTFAQSVAGIDRETPLFSGRSFRYPGLSILTGQQTAASATLRSAETNMGFMSKRFGNKFFSASHAQQRQNRLLNWSAPIDENYELRVRGASGASAFSLDFGLGLLEPRPNGFSTYKELWRAGIDTEHSETAGIGARFIRTGSGIKPGDESKQRGFDIFRKTHGIMPQRLLGLVGLYAMRELEPDYALALTTQGGTNLSTLGKSRGTCDYSGIFANVGFEASEDQNWLAINDFGSGFYDALERSRIRRSEADILHQTVLSINGASLVDPHGERPEDDTPIQLCTDQSPATIDRELSVYAPKPSRLRLTA